MLDVSVFWEGEGECVFFGYLAHCDLSHTHTYVYSIIFDVYVRQELSPFEFSFSEPLSEPKKA